VSEELGLRDARQRLQLRADDPDQVIRHLRRGHAIAAKGEIHQRERIAGLGIDDRVVGFFGQHIALARDLGLDLGDRGVRVVIELHVGLDHRDALAARRLHEVDAVGLGDGLLQGGRDEAFDEVAVRARIGRRHRHQRVFGLRILAQLERLDRTQTEHQDHQADDAREHRTPNEDIGQVHCTSPTADATIVSTTSTAMPLRSLF